MKEEDNKKTAAESDDYDDEGGKSRIVLVVAALVFIALATVAIIGIQSLIGDGTMAPKKIVQEVKMVNLPPPPPPPEIEPPPPEEEIVEEIPEEVETPDPIEDSVDDTPVGEDLAIDADGGAGLDGFGLLGKKGGRGLLEGGSGSEGKNYDFYASSVQQDLFDHLSDIKEIRRNRYSVIVHLWVNASGKVRTVKLVRSTGNADLDKSLRSALARMSKVSSAPPQGMPQPIRLKITSRI
ncbi:MAG: energy transducer TonB [Gammaproteobacteria bacterium]|nr:MAG: energy transducer TonB [Gammaproteobacteria bacterium]